MKRTLSEIANELNLQSGKEHMPSMIFITDQQAQPYPEQIIENLPHNSMVILRDYDLENRAMLGEALAYVCKQKQIKLLVAKELDLALQIGANGIHLPEYMLGELNTIKTDYPNMFISVACHCMEAALKAEEGGADAILLAPVFVTKSHPETIENSNLVLGPEILKEISALCEVPIYALGGVNAETAPRLMHTGVTGIAAIRGFY